MLRFPAIAAGLRWGSGPIRASNSGNDIALRGDPPTRTTGPSISLCPASPHAQAGLRLHLLSSSPGLRLLFSAHTSLTPTTYPPGPANHSVHSLWTPPSQLKHLLHADGRVAFSGRHFARVSTKQKTACQLSGGSAPWSIPQTYWWRVPANVQRYRETVASTGGSRDSFPPSGLLTRPPARNNICIP